MSVASYRSIACVFIAEINKLSRVAGFFCGSRVLLRVAGFVAGRGFLTKIARFFAGIFFAGFFSRVLISCYAVLARGGEIYNIGSLTDVFFSKYRVYFLVFC